ncbi:hypothetical protein WMY93_030608 [Mugilogobius chulae]|uniref:Uncharacterized protein n=1 Tax=Mugilogobius chulae TaxID=88201 RepID=A0AAW0MR65_9GOBI
MQAYQACKAIIIKLLSRPKAISPYHLRSVMLWACDRLPASFLCQDDNSAHFLLGLIDDLQHCLVNKTAPTTSSPVQHVRAALRRDGPAARQKTLLRTLGSHRASEEHHRARQSSAQVRTSNRPKLHSVGRRRRHSARRSFGQETAAAGDGNPGKSISVFINPDDVTRPHFRIDDKFF